MSESSGKSKKKKKQRAATKNAKEKQKKNETFSAMVMSYALLFICILPKESFMLKLSE